jgi:hypothetical protein
MSCNTCVDDRCQCARTRAINVFSAEYRTGKTVGRSEEFQRTSDALLELEQSGVIENHQMQAILDLILEKLTDVMDID